MGGFRITSSASSHINQYTRRPYQTRKKQGKKKKKKQKYIQSPKLCSFSWLYTLLFRLATSIPLRDVTQSHLISNPALPSSSHLIWFSLGR
ncbi:uncharacterized protein TRIVIDRAFT_215313 [Trichoderma virens Gv29-8]|uniref:Uncharacterized protein n=1 Tax=Hypocrea virens (strain Gv29-8 / FGSC 10586) TaxID=413071 RepID=G9MGC6_HYPVG|nr:uncharacterized protein TRIVIDRAFT_215313 [Trichoderma virens Gv29-8]EHK26575.1 hypothetical protein TRIVIDRAFT_215313 [Trichoderma virens Gv29-8]